MNYQLSPTPTPSLTHFPLSDYSSVTHWQDTIAHEIYNEHLEVFPKLINYLNNPLQVIPKNWELAEGWSRYDVDSEQWRPCDYNDLPDVMTLDIESHKESTTGHYRPILAIALGQHHWYGWRWAGDGFLYHIPFPSGRIVIGQNVRSHDARWLSSEYDFEDENRTVFIDIRWFAKMRFGIEGDRVRAQYERLHKNAQAGKGVPDWYNHACRESLPALAEHILGEQINKTVAPALSEWPIDKLKEHLIPKLPLATQKLVDQSQNYADIVAIASQTLATFEGLTPRTLAEYCGSIDVLTTFRLAQYLVNGAIQHHMPNPVSWLGIQELSKARSLVGNLDVATQNDRQSVEDARFQCEAILDRIKFDATPETHPHLDWDKPKSGINKDSPKWLTEYEKSDRALGSRIVAMVLGLTWKGSLIQWSKPKRCWENLLGESLPHPLEPSKPLRSSPLQPKYCDYAESGLLGCDTLDPQRFYDFYVMALEAQSEPFDYSSLYSVPTDYGTVVLGDIEPIDSIVRLPCDWHNEVLDRGELDEVEWSIESHLFDIWAAQIISSTMRSKDHILSSLFQDGAKVHHVLMGGTLESFCVKYPDQEQSFETLHDALKPIIQTIDAMASESGVRSPLLRVRIPESIDSQWADGGTLQRRKWLIESVRADMVHMLLATLSGFVLEYEIACELVGMANGLEMGLTWLVDPDQSEQFRACLGESIRLTTLSIFERVAASINEDKKPSEGDIQPRRYQGFGNMVKVNRELIEVF